VANFQKKSDVVLFGEFVKSQASSIDVLVNNVGQYFYGRLFDGNSDKLPEQLQVNLLSAHYLTATLADRFKHQRKGHIFTIGSLLSKNIREDAAFYTVSKQALYAWHKVLAEEMRQYNVKATFVMPSSTYTSSWEETNVKADELIQPESVAECIYDCYNLSGPFMVDELSMKTMQKKYD
jgi:short-subunit dehydrogenase